MIGVTALQLQDLDVVFQIGIGREQMEGLRHDVRLPLEGGRDHPNKGGQHKHRQSDHKDRYRDLHDPVLAGVAAHHNDSCHMLGPPFNQLCCCVRTGRW